MSSPAPPDPLAPHPPVATPGPVAAHPLVATPGPVAGPDGAVPRPAGSLPGGSPVVRVRVTFTPGQLVRASLEANRQLAAAIVLALVLAVLGPAVGDVGLGLAALLVGALLAYQLVVAPRKQLARGADQVDWTVDGGGLRLRTRVSDVGVAWSQVQRLTGRPGLLLFRVRPTRLVLPRRCLQPQDAAAIRGLARAAGVHIKGAT